MDLIIMKKNYDRRFIIIYVFFLITYKTHEYIIDHYYIFNLNLA